MEIIFKGYIFLNYLFITNSNQNDFLGRIMYVDAKREELEALQIRIGNAK
jgi:hypothetical protein